MVNEHIHVVTLTCTGTHGKRGFHSINFQLSKEIEL